MAKHAAARDLSFLNQPMFADRLDEIILLIDSLSDDTQNEGLSEIWIKLDKALDLVMSARDAANQYHTGTLEN